MYEEGTKVRITEKFATAPILKQFVGSVGKATIDVGKSGETQMVILSGTGGGLYVNPEHLEAA